MIRKHTYEVHYFQNGVDTGFRVTGTEWYGLVTAQKIAKALNREEQRHFRHMATKYKAVKY